MACYPAPVTLKRPSPLTLTTALLLVLLPTLALLQYRWVGQVSDAERERMQTHLRNAASQFRDALDGELIRAAVNLQIGTATARDGSSDRYSDRYDAWASTAAHPQIVANVYLIDEADKALRLRRWNPGSQTLEPIAWPDVLAAHRTALEQERRAFGSGSALVRPPLTLEDDALLLAPLRPTPGTPGTPGATGPVFGFTVIQFDIPYIETQLLPELALRHFSLNNQLDYRVAVTAARDPQRVIYRSDSQAPTDTARADAVEPLFALPTRGFFGRGGLGRGADPRRTVITVFRGGPAGPDGTSQTPDVRDFGRWILLAQHQSGSLEAHVAQVRQRNLAISFGILLLLTVSVAMLSVSSRRAQRLARQQMEFVAGVSHELRTPIAVIRSASENLSQGVVSSPERVKRYGETIGTEARRLGDMVERVLQYSGIEAGRIIAATAPLEPVSIVDAALRATAPIIAGHNITIERHIPETLPFILGDAPALVSAVQNLITNAAKYGGSDRWIGIRVRESGHGARREVQIAVEDHGSGIKQADLPHLFEPFYRGSDASAAQIQGNGLGLSIVKRIIEAHGGQVRVDTTVGAGTTFTLHLPVAPPDALQAARIELNPQSAPAHS